MSVTCTFGRRQALKSIVRATPAPRWSVARLPGLLPLSTARLLYGIGCTGVRPPCAVVSSCSSASPSRLALPVVTTPIAEVFGIPELIATRLATGPDGWITGEIDGVPSLREGKITRFEEWMHARGLRWDAVETTFYSDSMNDVPLLERVDHPVATNPDPRLRALAAERGWRILDLFPLTA